MNSKSTGEPILDHLQCYPVSTSDDPGLTASMCGVHPGHHPRNYLSNAVTYFGLYAFRRLAAGFRGRRWA